MKRIGLAIALGKDANSHTRTFTEAVNYSLRHFPEFRKHHLKIVNDEKSPEGGVRAATELAEWGAEVVVGHFSSLAALAALPVYREQGIPLMLPASTACELNTGESFGPFRYQKNNAELIEYSVANCLKDGKEGKVYAILQDNAYANRLLEHFPLLSDVTVIRNIPARTARDDTYMIIGYSDFAAETVKRLSQAQLYRVVLLDDADSPEAYASCIIRPARFSRVRSVSHLHKHGRSQPYWNETLLALSLAALPAYGSSTGTEFSAGFMTYLGYQEFDRRGCFGDCLLVAEDIEF